MRMVPRSSPGCNIAGTNFTSTWKLPLVPCGSRRIPNPEVGLKVERLIRSERRAKCAVLAKLLLCCFRAELRSSAVRNCPKSRARARTCPYLAFESLLNSLYQNLVLERFCKERKSSRVECGLAH